MERSDFDTEQVVPEQRREAIAQLIGALCYGLLRSFQMTARGATSAPSVALAEHQAGFAADEYRRFEILRRRLDELTPDAHAAMEAFRGPVDAFYESADADGWVETQVFHFVGDTLTADLSEILAGYLDGGTAASVREALSGRTEQEAFALEQIAEAAAEPDGQDLIRSFAGAMVGSALNRLRDALLGSDALEQVLEGPDGVKAFVLELLGRHRERLVRLGLDDLD